MYILFLIIIFFLYGLILSEIIDFIFPDHDITLPHYRIIIEMVAEITIAYIIYFSLSNYSNTLIKFLFKNITAYYPSYLNNILLCAFSFGIFRHLQKSTIKINHYKNKVYDYCKGYIKNFKMTH